MDLAALADVDPSVLRQVLPSWLADFVGEPEARAETLGLVGPRIAAWTDEDCVQVLAYLKALGEEHRVYDAHPQCREISRAWCGPVLLGGEVSGIEHLQSAVDQGPTLVIANHLSYFDANATDALLTRGGHGGLADRIVTAAGPKVYEDLFRRFAAGCIHTLPVPQSTTLGHTAKLSPRELARKAREGLAAAAQAMHDGYVVLVYPEGSRTRNGRLQSFVRGVHRWLSAAEGLQVVPLALVGTGQVMPIGSTQLRPGPVSLRFGAALQVGVDGSSREVLALAHGRIAELLPEALRPPPDMPATA